MLLRPNQDLKIGHLLSFDPSRVKSCMVAYVGRSFIICRPSNKCESINRVVNIHIKLRLANPTVRCNGTVLIIHSIGLTRAVEALASSSLFRK